MPADLTDAIEAAVEAFIFPAVEAEGGADISRVGVEVLIALVVLLLV